jgi:hypothetical protein
LRALCVVIPLTSLLLLAGPAPAQSISPYDRSWYRAPFWSGEYPSGFSVLEETTITIRPVLDPEAAPSVSCLLPEGATYHAWNFPRVEADALSFVSFTKIDELEVTQAHDAVLHTEPDGDEVSVHFAPGSRWRELVYYGEGAFLMEYDGALYTGDQDLVNVSRSRLGGESGYDEWLRVNCANNQWGWILMRDIVKDEETFDSPNIVDYGVAADLD